MQRPGDPPAVPRRRRMGHDRPGPGRRRRWRSESARYRGTWAGQESALAGPEQAGQALAALLAGRGRTLVVADDVWTADELAPFLAVTQVARLLVTTRRPLLLAGTQAHQIKIDAMAEPVARRLLARDLPPMAGYLERDLLELYGGWPLLLGLINRRLANELRSGASVDVAAADAAGKLRPQGPVPTRWTSPTQATASRQSRRRLTTASTRSTRRSATGSGSSGSSPRTARSRSASSSCSGRAPRAQRA